MSSNSIIFFLLVVQCIAPGLIYCAFTNAVLKTELLISSWVFLWCSSLAYISVSQTLHDLSFQHFCEARGQIHLQFTLGKPVRRNLSEKINTLILDALFVTNKN